MKKLLPFVTALVFFLVVHHDLFSQCSSCTQTISTAWSFPLIATAGTVVCITSTGSVIGDVVVSGGSVCNEGLLNPHTILITSGTLTNYGNIDAVNLAISGGVFDNFGKALIDSMSQSSGDAFVNNHDTLEGLAHSNYLHTTFVNTAYYNMYNTSIYYGSSFTNDGYIMNNNMSVFFNDSLHINKLLNGAGGQLHSDSLSVCDALFQNYGSTEITYDFSNGCQGHVQNFEYMDIGRDFSNDSSSVFYTECMVNVGRNWSNAGFVNGPSAGCGGFAVVGWTGNYGVYGNSGNADMCDAGSPVGGFDINTGSTGAGVTYCICSDSCVYHTGIQENNSAKNEITISNLYPNPFENEFFLEVNSFENERIIINLHNVYGQCVFSKPFNLFTGNMLIKIPVAGFADGIYLITLEGNNTNKTLTAIKLNNK